MLIWNVYREDVNRQSIEIFNIFNHGSFYADMVKIAKAYKKQIKDNTFDKKAFANDVDRKLMYYFWSKSEYEVIITSWPPYIEIEKIDKMKSEVEDYNSKWGRKPFRVNINLDVAEKIDIYDQVQLNFESFIDYIIDHIKEFKEKK